MFAPYADRNRPVGQGAIREGDLRMLSGRLIALVLIATLTIGSTATAIAQDATPEANAPAVGGGPAVGDTASYTLARMAINGLR
jgi:hypothetical protein